MRMVTAQHFAWHLARPLMCLAALLCGACAVHHPEYPALWSDRTSSIGADCSGLTGVYAGRSIDSSLEGKRPITLALQLYNVVYRFDQSPKIPVKLIGQVTAVRLDISPLHARADLLIGSDVVRVIDLDHGRSKMSCDGRALTFRGFRSATGGLVVDAEKHTVVLQKTANADLVVQFGHTDVGVALLFIPAGESSYDWALFPEVKM